VLRKWRALTAGIEPAASAAPAVIDALSDDLNTAGAIAALHGLAEAGDRAGLKASAGLIGLLEDRMGAWAVDPAIDAGRIGASPAWLRSACAPAKRATLPGPMRSATVWPRRVWC
jgi:cysteinyl-tRNA synthetase